jgi:hypothetical protein
MKYYWRAGRQFAGHLFDFQAEKGRALIPSPIDRRTETRAW